MPGAKGAGEPVPEMVGAPSAVPSNNRPLSIEGTQAAQTTNPVMAQTSASGAGSLTGGKGTTNIPSPIAPVTSGTNELTLGNLVAMAQQQGFGGGKGSGGK